MIGVPPSQFRVSKGRSVILRGWGLRVTALACAGTALLVGCEAQQTHIVKTTRYPDGTEVRYSNMSSGYGYNPNVTVDVSVHSDPYMPPRDAPTLAPTRGIERTDVRSSGHQGEVQFARPLDSASPTNFLAVAARLDGSGYVTVPVPVPSVPVITPGFTGGYWGPSPWATGMPAMPGAYGAGVFGPPIPNFGFRGR